MTMISKLSEQALYKYTQGTRIISHQHLVQLAQLASDSNSLVKLKKLPGRNILLVETRV